MLFAYLDDIYVLCDPSRVAKISLQVEQSLCKVSWHPSHPWEDQAAIRPEDSDTIGVEVWSGGGPKDDRGLAVLGVPIAHKAFEQKWLADKGQ